jgi:predicted nuclease of predicted toxin-antitoxin system
MKIRLYADEDAMAHRLAHELRMRGLDITTALDEGMIDRPDVALLQYASRQGRVLYSYNTADYYRLHREFLAQGKQHAGIILAQQQRYSIGEQLRRLLRIAAIKSAEDMQNGIEFLTACG